MKKVIITGATGMVGRGVLLECLDSEQISKVLIVNRKPLGLQHPKLEELILEDFARVSFIADQLAGYDACFYCMGVSAVGLSEAAYTNITFELAALFADVLCKRNPQLVFNYVSGMGTDSSEKGRSMWARIKGRTENMILNKGFADAYAFRPGLIIPERGIRSNTGWYQTFYSIMRPLFPLLKRSAAITDTTRVGKAMINTLFYPQQLKHLENRDINHLAGMH